MATHSGILARKVPWTEESLADYGSRDHKRVGHNRTTENSNNVHVMEYYSTLKKREILSYATIWKNLKNVMLSEISQPQKDKYCTVSLIFI